MIDSVAEERFASLVAAMADPPRVVRSQGKGFGGGQLTVGGKIFAMLVREALVLKLPARRVNELIEAGEGQRFDANKGRPMREWLVLRQDSALDWLGLAQEAQAFVSS